MFILLSPTSFYSATRASQHIIDYRLYRLYYGLDLSNFLEVTMPHYLISFPSFLLYMFIFFKDYFYLIKLMYISHAFRNKLSVSSVFFYGFILVGMFPDRLRVVSHFPSGIVERAKLERA